MYYTLFLQPPTLVSLVPGPHPLTRRNGLVNQVEFLGLAGALATVVENPLKKSMDTQMEVNKF